jgi:hypothetical protein
LLAGSLRQPYKYVTNVSERQRTSTNVSERQRTSANVSERQRTSTNVSERQRTSANVSERQRTSTNVSERQRTSANVNERQRTSANVSERQRTSTNAVHGRSLVFIVVRWCSLSFVGVHCRSSVFTVVRRCSLSLGVVGVIPNVYLRFSWRQTTFTSRSLRHRMPPGVPNQSLFWYLGRALRSTSRRRPRRSSTTIQLPDTWPILWLCTCSLTERASVISKWLICSP